MAPLRRQARLATPASALCRNAQGVQVRDALGQWDRFDKVVLACHADQALALLADATARERALLGRFAYSSNTVWLHSDAGLMPRRREVWSSWNYVAEGSGRDGKPSVTYWMNRLQNIDYSKPLFVSLNPPFEPDEALTFGKYICEHPQYNALAFAAQKRLGEIQGRRHTWFCGAWTGYGFHEDGLASAVRVARGLGAKVPWGRELGAPQQKSRPPVMVAGFPASPVPAELF